MKKKFLGFFSIFILLFLTTSNVYAKGIAQAGESVVQEGNYNSLRLVAGENVTNKANIDGLSLIAGNELKLEGSAPYGFYAGNNVIISEQIEKDMFVAGNSIQILKDAVIGRDVYIAGNNIKISTDIKRDLKSAGDSIDLSGVSIGGDAYVISDKIILDENTIIDGKLTYPEDADIKGIDKATIGSVETKHYEEVNFEYSIVDSIYDFIFSTIAAFVAIVVLFYLIPKAKEKLDNVDLKVGSIAKIVGIGIIVLIVVPIISLIALFTRVLTPLALITLAIYVIGIYLSSLLGYYIVGNILTTKLFKNDNMYLAIICGILSVKIIKLIPIIGGLVGAIVLFYGLGLIYNFIKSRGK